MLLIRFANIPLIFTPVLLYVSWNRLPGATCSSKKKKPCHPSGNIPGLVVPLIALYLKTRSLMFSKQPIQALRLAYAANTARTDCCGCEVNCITCALNSHKVCDLFHADKKLHNSLYFESESKRMFTTCQSIIMCSFKCCKSVGYRRGSNSLVFHPGTMLGLKVKCLWPSIRQHSSYCGLPFRCDIPQIT